MATAVEEGHPSSHFDTERAFVRSAVDGEIRSRLSHRLWGLVSEGGHAQQSYSWRGADQSTMGLTTAVFEPRELRFFAVSHRLFERGSSKEFRMIIITYVNDVIVAGEADAVEKVRRHLNVFFVTKNLGESSHYDG